MDSSLTLIKIVHKLKSYSATRVFAICVGELGAEICKDMQ